MKGVGSRFYLAPEILFHKSYDFKVDVWSSTAVVYLLLIGQLPFYGQNLSQMRFEMQGKDIEKEFANDRWVGLSDEAKDFVRQGMQKSRCKRATSD